MKSNKILWGIGGLIAACLIVYFAFISPTPQDGDIQGAIGAAEKYQTEQIKPEDVVLAGEETGTAAGETGQLVVQEMASMLERLSIADQARIFQQGKLAQHTEWLGRLEPATKAEMWGRLEPAEQLEAFQKFSGEYQQALLGAMSLTQDAFQRKPLAEQVTTLGKLSTPEKAMMLDRASAATKQLALERASVEHQAAMIRTADLQERMVALQGCNARTQQEIFGKMFVQNAPAFLGRATQMDMERVWQAVSIGDKEDMLKRLTVNEQAQLCAKAPAAVQMELLRRASAQDRVGAFFNAMSAQEVALAFQEASPREQVAMFERAGKPFYEEALGRAGVPMANYDKFDLQGKMDAIHKVSANDLTTAFKRADLAQQDQLLSKISSATKQQCLERLTAEKWAGLYGHLTQAEKFDLVGRVPGVTSQLLQRSEKMQEVGELYGRTIFKDAMAH